LMCNKFFALWLCHRTPLTISTLTDTHSLHCTFTRWFKKYYC